MGTASRRVAVVACLLAAVLGMSTSTITAAVAEPVFHPPIGGPPPAPGFDCAGSLIGKHLNRPIVAIASHPTNGPGGYWLAAADGGVFSFGDAPFYGSTGSMVLNRPIVGMVPTAGGRGYWLVASDGGVFSFGDAQFYGSTASLTLHRPIVGMAAMRDGRGYWLVASDGEVFSFGHARFYGSAASIRLNQPIIGMAAAVDDDGYWLAAADAGIFTFGSARYFGGGPVRREGATVTDFSAFAMSDNYDGYIVANRNRDVLRAFGQAEQYGLGSRPGDRTPLAGLAFGHGQGHFGYLMATQGGGVYLQRHDERIAC